MGPIEMAQFVGIVHNDGDVQAGDGLQWRQGLDAQGTGASGGRRSPILFERI